jgi:cytoskeletal protein CcmA (bactofilin family)
MVAAGDVWSGKRPADPVRREIADIRFGGEEADLRAGGAGALDQPKRFGRRMVFGIGYHERDMLAGGERRDFGAIGPGARRGTGTIQTAVASRASPASPAEMRAVSWGNPKASRPSGQVALVRTGPGGHNSAPKKETTQENKVMANETHESVIGSDVEIIGTIKSSGTVRLDGKLDGELICGGNAILGKTAQVKGNVTATSVSIEGKINGNLLAKDKIEMKATATVNGDIKARRLSVEDGVTFVGRSEVNPNSQPVPAPQLNVPQR